MADWVGYPIALAGLLVLAAWLGLRHGRKVSRTAGLALFMLGFGQMFDPPRRHMIEAIGGEEQDGESSGEPKDATGGS